MHQANARDAEVRARHRRNVDCAHNPIYPDKENF